MKSKPTIVHQQPSEAAREQGYMLLSVLFVAAIVVISLSGDPEGTPGNSARQRNRNHSPRPAVHARNQLYYRRFRTYPTNVDALLDTNGIRFLRKRYDDPLTLERMTGNLSCSAKTEHPSPWAYLELQLAYRSLLVWWAILATLDRLPQATPPRTPTDRQSGSSDGVSANPSAQIFGSAPIIGVSPRGAGESILVYKTKDHATMVGVLSIVQSPTRHFKDYFPNNRLPGLRTLVVRGSISAHLLQTPRPAPTFSASYQAREKLSSFHRQRLCPTAAGVDARQTSK